MSNRLMFETGLDGSGFERGLAKLGAQGANALKNFVVGAFGVYSVQQALAKTVESCTELVHASDKLGMTVEQLQIMRRAAQESGVEFEKLVGSVNKLAAIRENILQGGKGSKEQLNALARLGVTPDMVRTMTATSIMEGPIAQKVKNTNPADIANDLKIVFGRAFGDLIPFLKTDFGSLEAKMRSFGMIVDSTTAHELKMFGDQVGLIAGIMTTQLAPWLVKLGKALFDLMESFAIASEYFGTLVGAWMHGQFRGSNRDAGIAAGIVKDEYDEKRKGFEDKAKNPEPTPPPTIPEELPEAETKAEKKAQIVHPPSPKGIGVGREPADALVRTGNFLGSAKGQIDALASEHLAVARGTWETIKKVEQNTRPRTDPPGRATYPVH